jgi:hypothetical protein
LGFIELFQEFLEFVTKKRIKTPVVYQDCNVVVSFITIRVENYAQSICRPGCLERRW